MDLLIGLEESACRGLEHIGLSDEYSLEVVFLEVEELLSSNIGLFTPEERDKSLCPVLKKGVCVC